MFFSASQIKTSIKVLSEIHTFFGITFLACKKIDLPVGQKVEVQLDAITKEFMERHNKLDPQSNFYFQPFASSNQNKKWVRSDYPSSGLQAVNTQTFGSAFLHDRNTRLWAWKNSYVDVLESKLLRRKKISSFDLAVWIYRDFNWPVGTKAAEVIARFFREYEITAEERVRLFETKPSEFSEPHLQETGVTWVELSRLISAPPDAKPDEGGTLTHLRTRGLGPANRFDFRPAQRLTLITGDNGLGKSFLLDTAWWGLTGTRPS
jgi:hypothetical protein